MSRSPGMSAHKAANHSPEQFARVKFKLLHEFSVVQHNNLPEGEEGAER